MAVRLAAQLAPSAAAPGPWQLQGSCLAPAPPQARLREHAGPRELTQRPLLAGSRVSGWH